MSKPIFNDAAPPAALEVRIVEPGVLAVTMVVGKERSATLFLSALDALSFAHSVLGKATELAHVLTERQQGAQRPLVDTGRGSGDRLVLTHEEIAAQKNVHPIKPRT